MQVSTKLHQTVLLENSDLKVLS